jgi:hypothetical protein
MKTYYDLLPFEIYEFDLNFDGLIIHGGLKREGRINVRAEDTLYGIKNEYSEYISVMTDDVYNDSNGINKYLSLQYYNENNRDIFYLYGITHFMRVEYINFETTIIDEVDVDKGDLTNYLLNSKVYEGAKITFADLTYRMKIKLSLALSTKNLFINGLGYLKNGGLEITQIPFTNLYSITCELILNGKNFNINSEGNVGRSEDYRKVFIPKLVSAGSDTYIKI